MSILTNDHAAFIYSERLLDYKFSDDHPFNQKRIAYTFDLLQSLGAFENAIILPPRQATIAEICSVHSEEYVQGIVQASSGELKKSAAQKIGIGTDDTPIFNDMHNATSWLVGGTLRAVEAIFEDGYSHACHIGGGLHHGFRSHASGFCIYNDSAIAIQQMIQRYGVKVLYVDTDAHHGDGVQSIFYDSPNVCTLSLHETGRYLFPGTGFVEERGVGKGYGYSFNIPLDAFTEDDSFIYAYESALYEIVQWFKPDIIVSQNGADAHHWDPLTHLSCSMRLYENIPQVVHKLAHEYCNGRWLAVGGGGYSIENVVPRAWSLLWLEMSNQKHLLQQHLPDEWLHAMEHSTGKQPFSKWFDYGDLGITIPRRSEIEEKNYYTVQKALSIIKNI
ncbi:MAG: acetoin utilization protein AcuC [Bacilli bacterium]